MVVAVLFLTERRTKGERDMHAINLVKLNILLRLVWKVAVC